MREGPGYKLAKHIVRTLRAAGHDAWLVGGCVRDLLLGAPAQDFDVATSATPPELLRQFPRALQVGAHFGVILIKDGDASVEVATFRSDHAYLDGRHPGRVEFERDPRQDALRRDFSINAMMMDQETGQILDFTGGREDLKAKLVRAVGEPAARFEEDHLRMLRAVRFAARLGFAIEPETLRAIRRRRALVAKVASERIQDELARILTEGGARRGFELLDESGLLEQVLPEVAAMKGVPQPPEYHPEGDVWTHVLLMLEQLERPSLTLALAVLLHDVGKPPTFQIKDRIRFHGHAETGARMAGEILAHLRFPVQATETVRLLVANHSRFQDVRNMRESTLKRFLRLDHFDELLELHRIDCVASHRRMENYEFVRRKLAEFTAEKLRPPRLITGWDLLELGYEPGPRFRSMLDAVEDAQLEGQIHTRDEAIAFVRERFPTRDGT